MSRPTPRLLTTDEIDRQLQDLPGVAPGSAGSLVLSLRAPSFLDAVRLIDLLAPDAEQMDHHPDVDLRWRTVVLTFSTHSAGGVTQLDVELAHRALEAAKTVGAQALAPAERVEIALDCTDAASILPFWKAGLGYREVTTGKGSSQAATELYDPTGRGPVLWFQPMDPPRRERSRFHLDVYVPDDQAMARVEACLAAGGVLTTDEHAPSWWVLADPEGNELCICTRAPHPGDRDPAAADG
jgi:4a-hydroxytetrahydrobiopterin dehydratase